MSIWSQNNCFKKQLRSVAYSAFKNFAIFSKLVSFSKKSIVYKMFEMFISLHIRYQNDFLHKIRSVAYSVFL